MVPRISVFAMLFMTGGKPCRRSTAGRLEVTRLPSLRMGFVVVCRPAPTAGSRGAPADDSGRRSEAGAHTAGGRCRDPRQRRRGRGPTGSRPDGRPRPCSERSTDHATPPRSRRDAPTNGRRGRARRRRWPCAAQLKIPDLRRVNNATTNSAAIPDSCYFPRPLAVQYR